MKTKSTLSDKPLRVDFFVCYAIIVLEIKRLLYLKITERKEGIL